MSKKSETPGETGKNSPDDRDAAALASQGLEPEKLDHRLDKTFAYIDTAASGPGRPPGSPEFTEPNAVLPFYLRNAPVRGRLVRLGALGDRLIARHALPKPVLHLGGRALALTAALATALKFEGSFSLQLRGDGPVSLLASDCTSGGGLRFMAMTAADAPAQWPESDAGLLGQGHLAFTMDQTGRTERQQGIVQITGESLDQMAEEYFRTSEQHDCRIFLFCENLAEKWQAGGLILEKIASTGGNESEAERQRETAGESMSPEAIADLWETAVTFGATLKAAELLDETLPLERLAHRLFGALDPVLGAPRPLSFGCRCTRSRLAHMLAGFGGDELDQMAIDGRISVDCGFCNNRFVFNRSHFDLPPNIRPAPAEGGAA